MAFSPARELEFRTAMERVSIEAIAPVLGARLHLVRPWRQAKPMHRAGFSEGPAVD
jgi:hypothetical protein